MSVTIVVGAQGGDEGKGKIIDFLSGDNTIIVRYQGGDNAAHTVVVDQKAHIFHLIPSGILQPNTVALLGSGMVINPDSLLAEINELKKMGIEGRVLISEKAHIVFPFHQQLDICSDRKNGIIDTTHRGIGPAYMDKAAREGIRFEDLKYPQYVKHKLEILLPRINSMLKLYGSNLYDCNQEFERCMRWRKQLMEVIVEPVSYLHNSLCGGKNILFEGQLGLLRDIDLGTYPYVTSSSPTAAYACAASGIPISKVNKIIGVARAYPILAGNGPFPTEMSEDIAVILRGTGEKPDDEYGGTTGRKRRIGWLDLPVLKFSTKINGYTELVLCKLDRLDNFNEILVCTDYTLDGKIIDYMPDSKTLERVIPKYEKFPGWLESTRNVRNIKDLPINARKYVHFIEEKIGVPITAVGVGPDREEIAT